MVIVQFDNGYFGVKLCYGAFLDKDSPDLTWFLKGNVRRWAMVHNLEQAQYIVKRYQDHHKPLKYKNFKS